MCDSDRQDQESLARRMAYILGESSAAAQALKLLDSLRSEGKRAWIYLHQRTWIVGQEE